MTEGEGPVSRWILSILNDLDRKTPRCKHPSNCGKNITFSIFKYLFMGFSLRLAIEMVMLTLRGRLSIRRL